MMLDDRLLGTYIDTFYGYGNYGGDWWLVGMEEGSTGGVAEVADRLRLWEERGRRELEDVEVFAASPDLGKWFTPRPPLQPTWRGLIRLILSAEARATDAETARAYQSTQLGRGSSNNCILELMPLPSPSIGDWMYGVCSTRPELRDRRTYLAQVAAAGVEHLRRRIHEHRPSVVIFYSQLYLARWEQIAGARFSAAGPSGVQMIKTNDTLFVMTKHPTSRGVTTDYFVKAGVAVSSAVRNQPRPG